MTVETAAHDHGLVGAVLISAADMGDWSGLGADKIAAIMQDLMESLAGVTAKSMADEVVANAAAFRFSSAAAGLAQTPMLVLSANDGVARETDALVAELRAKGNQRITSIHADTDHNWSDKRIFLESTIIAWLGTLQ